MFHFTTFLSTNCCTVSLCDLAIILYAVIDPEAQATAPVTSYGTGGKCSSKVEGGRAQRHRADVEVHGGRAISLSPYLVLGSKAPT